MDQELDAKEQLEIWWSPRVNPVIDAIYLKDRDLGQARRENLLRLLEAVTNPLQLESIERLVFKTCEEAGLVDAEVRITVARKRREFDEQPPVVP